MKFRVGATVRVVKPYSGGNFEDGDIVKIIQIGDDDGEELNCYGAISPYDGWKWYLNEDEVAPITLGDWVRTMNNEEMADFFAATVANMYGDKVDSKEKLRLIFTKTFEAPNPSGRM